VSNDLDGRVVLVTGGARGLGRSHAHALAARGAAVVVNDSGAALDGTCADPAAADATAAEIRAAGGNAIASAADVATPAGARQAVAAALDEFGRLDALVANAGILRDRTFAKMPLEDFDAVVRVHLSAAAYCAHAAWPALVTSGSGRIVLTTSASGLYGQFGQANYAAAKMGLVGLLHVLGQEGARTGVLVNAIAPVATTRMTEPLLPPDALRELAPELVSPVVAHLVSADCRQTGLVLEVGAGQVARVQVVASAPVRLPADDDGVAEVLNRLAAAEGGTSFRSTNEAVARLLPAAGLQAPARER
jgi:NAD(P)-dependent dehydrogenase (short-subunit alcohol dehydrogenase family)